jgi:hypothetical protein
MVVPLLILDVAPGEDVFSRSCAREADDAEPSRSGTGLVGGEPRLEQV